MKKYLHYILYMLIIAFLSVPLRVGADSGFDAGYDSGSSSWDSSSDWDSGSYWDYDSNSSSDSIFTMIIGVFYADVLAYAGYLKLREKASQKFKKKKMPIWGTIS